MNNDLDKKTHLFDLTQRMNYRIGICHCGNQYNSAESEQECEQCRVKPNSKLRKPSEILYQYLLDSIVYAKQLGYQESDFLQQMKKLLIEKKVI